MSQYATLGEQRIVSGSLSVPYYGTFVGDLVLAESRPLDGQVSLMFGNISATCHIFRSAGFAGSKSARIIGGYGGWRADIPSQAYYSPNGIKKSLILGDAASLCGEVVSSFEDSVVGGAYVRERGPGSMTLRALFDDVWYIGLDGVTNVKPRADQTQINSEFTVSAWSGGKGLFEIATEDMASWMPARKFSSPTVTGMQTISLTYIEFDNEGKTRLHVLSTGDTNA